MLHEKLSSKCIQVNPTTLFVTEFRIIWIRICPSLCQCPLHGRMVHQFFRRWSPQPDSLSVLYGETRCSIVCAADTILTGCLVSKCPQVYSPTHAFPFPPDFSPASCSAVARRTHLSPQ